MKAQWQVLAAVGLALVASCSGGDGENVASSVAEALGQGGGSGPPVWGDDPCANPNLTGTVHDHNGDHQFIGTDGPDVIVGTDGNDFIWGNGGNDIICARGGDDEVHGGDGDDYIDGGSGNDTIYAGNGNDVVHGRAGGDYIWGEGGDDALFGDILDDHIWGGDGDDLLVGGHGTDEMHGGAGNDWLRGDTGNDAFFGDEGTDVASFMTAMPPGDADPVHPNDTAGINGEIVDFTDPCIDPDDVPVQRHDGCAYGDGEREPLDSIEVVVGSPYNDHFVSTEGSRRFIGGFGDDQFDVAQSDDVVDGAANDMCNGTPCSGQGLIVPPGKVFVFVDPHSRDLGVGIVGTALADVLLVSPVNKKLEVSTQGMTSLAAGPGCTAQSASKVVCDIPSTLRFVAAYGDDGDDTVTLKGTFPRDFTSHVNGGKGDDVLVGDDEQDVLFTGIMGKDRLEGNGGDDALLSESEPDVNAHKPRGSSYPDGADVLLAGPGDDQLVADYPCGAHTYSGGDGIDVAGFARSGSPRIFAQLNGPASVHATFYGKSYNPDLCDVGMATSLAPDLEILEASSGDDELWGNDEANTIWGRKGNDVIRGLGGDDTIAGLEGNDTLYGGAGHDMIEGGPGFDTFYAADGESDAIVCGSGGGKIASRDKSDNIFGCN